MQSKQNRPNPVQTDAEKLQLWMDIQKLLLKQGKIIQKIHLLDTLFDLYCSDLQGSSDENIK